MDITLPANSWHHNDGDNLVVWAMPEHTESAPYLVMFKRRPRTGDTYGYQVKVVRSFLDSETSVRKNQIIEANFRNVAWQTVTESDAAFAVFQGIIADADLKDAALRTGQLFK